MVESQETAVAISLLGAKNRAVQTPGTEAVAQLDGSGHIYVLNHLGDVEYEEAFTAAILTSAGQQLNPKVLNSNSIYIIANIPTGLAGAAANLSTLDEIKAFNALITTQLDYKEAALANVDAKPVLIGDPSHTKTGDVVRMLVQINPVISRMELAAVGTSDDRIESFTVTGVYVDSYYRQFNFGGSFDVAAGKYEQYSSKDFSAYGTPMGQWHANTRVGGWISEEISGRQVAHPRADIAVAQHWAHNVVAGYLPRFIIEVDNVKVDETKVEPVVGKRYITISGYKGLSAFQRGRIYVVGGSGLNGGIDFELEDLKEIPNPEEVTVIVDVEVIKWEVEDLPYELF
ncbi:MAG: hypothetical protein LBI15_05970 [Dysgonamonadaceae bacterium]|nr:hypothetical protein [Dysgonamonadaceae bacterium]